MTPAPIPGGRRPDTEQDVPIRLYRFKTKTRWRWVAKLPTVPGGMEAYGALPSEALKALAEGMDGEDCAALLRDAEPSGEFPDRPPCFRCEKREARPGQLMCSVCIAWCEVMPSDWPGSA